MQPRPSPLPLQAATSLAYRCMRFGRHDRALPLFQLLCTLSPTQASLRLGLAYCLLNTGRPEEALQALAPMEMSDRSSIHFVRGLALHALGDVQQARQAFNDYAQARFAPAPQPQ